MLQLIFHVVCCHDWLDGVGGRYACQQSSPARGIQNFGRGAVWPSIGTSATTLRRAGVVNLDDDHACMYTIDY